jgi:hypothetical protein
MTPRSAWRRLDRYLLRNHPEVWSLGLHSLHATVIATTAVLALVVWRLPLEDLLELFPLVRVIVMVFVLPVLLFFLLLLMADKVHPLTRRRWPRALSHWYFLIVFSSPILFVSLLAQERFQPLTRGYDLNALLDVQKVCQGSPSTPPKEECVEAVSRSIGRPREQLTPEAIRQARRLSQVAPDDLILNWGDILLFLLLILYAGEGFELTLSDARLQKDTVALVGLLQILHLMALAIFQLHLVLPNERPDNAFSSSLVMGIAVLISLALLHFTCSSHRRRGAVLMWSWTTILMGLPTLVILIPLLFSSPEQRRLHQALLLGGFLLLTPWLQRQHDRMRALPI